MQEQNAARDSNRRQGTWVGRWCLFVRSALWRPCGAYRTRALYVHRILCEQRTADEPGVYGDWFDGEVHATSIN